MRQTYPCTVALRVSLSAPARNWGEQTERTFASAAGDFGVAAVALRQVRGNLGTAEAFSGV
jgi:hypothetical protein